MGFGLEQKGLALAEGTLIKIRGLVAFRTGFTYWFLVGEAGS